ncbi:hypothetical protein JCM24511_01999 [Saitozyma sp. JCM 24511]|nr:hypothetical protein JCM24511_01999 [Saitozyma sp. JCM 24511]
MTRAAKVWRWSVTPEKVAGERPLGAHKGHVERADGDTSDLRGDEFSTVCRVDDDSRIRPCSTLLAYKDARSISLLEQDNNPSWLVNKYLDSVVDQKIRQCQTSKLRFLPVVLSYSGMMIGIRTKVFAS